MHFFVGQLSGTTTTMASGRFNLSPLLSKKQRTVLNKSELCNILLANGHRELTKLMTGDVDNVDQEQLARHVMYLFRNERRMKDLLMAVFDGVTADSLREENGSLRVYIMACISRYGRVFLDRCLNGYLNKMKKVTSKTVEQWTTDLITDIKNHITSLPDPVKLLCQVLYSKSLEYRCLCGYFFLRFLCPEMMTKVFKQDPKQGKKYKMVKEVGEMLMTIGNCSDDTSKATNPYIAAKAKDIPQLFTFTTAVDGSGWNYTSSPLVGSDSDRGVINYFSQYIKHIIPDPVSLKDKHVVGLCRVQSDDRLNVQISPRLRDKTEQLERVPSLSNKLKKFTSSLLNSSQHNMSNWLKLSPRNKDNV